MEFSCESCPCENAEADVIRQHSSANRFLLNLIIYPIVVE